MQEKGQKVSGILADSAMQWEGQPARRGTGKMPVLQALQQLIDFFFDLIG